MIELKPLSGLKIGEEGTVCQILGDKATYHRLIYLGFEVGASVRVINRGKLSHMLEPSMIIDLNGRSLLLSLKDASKVLVESRTRKRIPNPFIPNPFLRYPGPGLGLPIYT